jgi:hypothetical protein
MVSMVEINGRGGIPQLTAAPEDRQPGKVSDKYALIFPNKRGAGYDTGGFFTRVARACRNVDLTLRVRKFHHAERDAYNKRQLAVVLIADGLEDHRPDRDG